MINELFQDQKIISRIQSKLPELFQLAELESSRAGKIGMEVGSVREKILIALLIHKFGSENVHTNLPIHEPEIDVVVNGNPMSIKTITGKRISGVKLIWTVDREQVLIFSDEYQPRCDMLLSHINWGGLGGLFYFTRELQETIMQKMGRKMYLKLPKPGTNPRGVEISLQAIRTLAEYPQSKNIPIKWAKKDIIFNPYNRWIKLWEQD